MERILVLIDSSDVVVNVIVATDDYTPPAGITAVEAPGARIGWLWGNGEQIEPNPSEPGPEEP